ncbi:hypothetical protein HZA76_04200 [Candidatus Roizmanbacteria bacterium]|nr:hypothetical protein [Candidatus Roizmanbacteria bacterium]
MKLPFFSKLVDQDEVYLGLFLKEEEGIALIMVKKQGQIIIREKERFIYTNGWENLTDDVDEVLYRLEKNLNIQLSKTIFFVYSHLVDDKTNDIKKPYLVKIKEVVKNLELTAMGYIECFEAVSFYLAKKEESPLTGVLLELDKHQLSLFVYKGGKLDYKSVLARTDDIVADFIQATSGLKTKAMLPSRIILYDSQNIDEAAAKIIGHRWGQDYFVQIPKIGILKEEEVTQGLVDVFSGQIKGKETVFVEEKKPIQSQSFGFVVGQDVGEVIESKYPVQEKPKIKFNFDFLSRLPKIKIPKVDLTFLKGRTGIILGIVIIVISLFSNEYFFHRAQLTIYLPSQVVRKSMSETVSYKTASQSADFSETISTTGKKEVGDKAKGTVTLHSFDDKERTFNKGTSFVASELKFVLDGDVKVASSSLAADGSAKLPGKSNGTVTAVSIGPESNLSKGQRFQIEDLAKENFFAINEAALSGGSKKEVRTVSLTDQKNLEKSVMDKAKKQEKAPTFSKSDEIISDLSETTLDNAKYSKEVGEEGDKLTLNAKVKTNYYAYNKDLLLKKIMEEVGQEVKKEYKIREENVNFIIKKVEKTDEEVQLNLDIKAKAVKEFDQEEAVKKIMGKNKTSLETILKSDFKVQGYNIVIENPIPFLKNFLPFFNQNLFIKISSL